MTRVLRIFSAEVFRTLCSAAAPVDNPRCGAVTFVQRFDSRISPNVHFHLVALDGVYARKEGHEAPVFLEASRPSVADLTGICTRVAARVLRMLKRRKPGNDEPTVMDQVRQASQLALPAVTVNDEGVDKPRRDPLERRFDRKRNADAGEAEGFNLQATVRIEAHDRTGRELLCRYGARPPFSASRLTVLDDDTVLYAMKKPGRRGETHLRLTPLAFLGRLASIIPPPRFNLTRYHGVLAPASPWREAIVPPPPATPRCFRRRQKAAKGTPPTPRPAWSIDWATLLRRIYKIDILACKCGGRLEWIAVVTDPRVIRRILDHLDRPDPPRQRARAPPMAPPPPITQPPLAF